MSGEAPVLEIAPNAPDEEVIAALERLLEEARAGELRGFVAAAAYQGGDFRTVRAAEGAHLVALVGQLMFAIRDLTSDDEDEE